MVVAASASSAAGPSGVGRSGASWRASASASSADSVSGTPTGTSPRYICSGVTRSRSVAGSPSGWLPARSISSTPSTPASSALASAATESAMTRWKGSDGAPADDPKRGRSRSSAVSIPAS